MVKASKTKMNYISEYDKTMYDRVLVRLPKGTKEQIQLTGESVNGFINRLVKSELERIESKEDR